MIDSGRVLLVSFAALAQLLLSFHFTLAEAVQIVVASDESQACVQKQLAKKHLRQRNSSSTRSCLCDPTVARVLLPRVRGDDRRICDFRSRADRRQDIDVVPPSDIILIRRHSPPLATARAAVASLAAEAQGFLALSATETQSALSSTRRVFGAGR